MDLFFDRYYRLIVNGGGVDPELKAQIRAGTFPVGAISQARHALIASLDKTRIYIFTLDALQIVTNTASHLNLQSLPDPHMPIYPAWIEFPGMTIGTEEMPVMALHFFAEDQCELVVGNATGKALTKRNGQWWFGQGACTVPCERAALDDGREVPALPHRPGCVCQRARDTWHALLVAFGMALRAQGIEQETVYRTQGQQRQHPQRPTKADRNKPPQPTYTVLHLTKRVISADNADREPAEQQGTRADLPARLIAVDSYIKHLDPQHNARWKQERFVVVSGYQKMQHGQPMRIIVKE